MSVSRNANTDNQWAQQSSHIPHPAVEENKTWRTKMNNGEHNAVALASPQRKTSGEEVIFCRRLSENEETIPKTSSTKLSGPQIYERYYVRLAEESPKRNNDELSDSSAFYDSFNCRETDVCRDSSDTESNSSYTSGEIGTTIKVVEYEVASATNSDNMFSNDSSSGTDDFILAAFATAICHTSKCSSDFADTEEDSSDTDTKYDSEFSAADYWVCVKCKNKKNNPMFRYCEKCYQIRKTHFPPRPRLRKSRSAIKRERSPLGCPSVKRSATTSEIDKSLKRRRTEETLKDDNLANLITPQSSSSSLQSGSTGTSGRLVVGISRNKSSSTAGSSSDEDDNIASQFYKVSSNETHCEGKTRADSIYLSHSGRNTKLNEQKPAQHLRMAAKRRLVKDLSKYKSLSKRKCYEPNVVPSNTETDADLVLSQSVGGSQNTQKDSGFSSAPSSQERKSSCEQHSDENYDRNCGNGGESSDTVCDELNDSDIAEMSEEKNCIPSTLEFDFNSQEQALGRHVSEVVPPTTAESLAKSPLVQSLSECSDAYTNVRASASDPDMLQLSSIKESKLRSLQTQSTENNGDFSSYGSCMTCLIEPKNGVFVHSRFLHLCCCYKCAVKIWAKKKKCPICNCAVKNVKKLFVY